jgi:hypothetical protein
MIFWSKLSPSEKHRRHPTIFSCFYSVFFGSRTQNITSQYHLMLLSTRVEKWMKISFNVDFGAWNSNNIKVEIWFLLLLLLILPFQIWLIFFEKKSHFQQHTRCTLFLRSGCFKQSLKWKIMSFLREKGHNGKSCLNGNHIFLFQKRKFICTYLPTLWLLSVSFVHRCLLLILNGFVFSGTPQQREWRKR